jgi:hypothetical protein
MVEPYTIKKITLPMSRLDAMPSQHRSALLMFGLLANDANWLRKVLLSAVNGISNTPEGQASFSLTMLMATTLAGKIHEGWCRYNAGWLGKAIADLELPEELQKIHSKLLMTLVKDSIIHRIRKNSSFHYPSKPLDFIKFSDHVDDTDATVLLTSKGYSGDVLSHISTLAGIEALLSISGAQDYMVALLEVWKEVIETAEMYSEFISGHIALLLNKYFEDINIEDIVLDIAPDVFEFPIKFFVQPPPELG